MSWEDALPPQKAHKRVPGPVRIGMVKYRKDRGRPLLSIVLAGNIVDRLAPGKDRRFSVQFGKGAENRHQLRVFPDRNGLFQPAELHNPGGKTGRFRLMVVPRIGFPDCAVPLQDCRYVIESKGDVALLIDLPSWAWEPGAKGAVERRARVPA